MDVAVPEHFFTDPKLKSFFLMILADMTILPEEYPALGIPFSNQEAAYDRRIPPRRALGIGPKNITYQFIAGGCGRLVEALVSVIHANGGKIHTGRTVTSISVGKDRVTGIELDDGTEASADLVLASGDARHCFFELIGREKLPGSLVAAEAQQLIHACNHSADLQEGLRARAEKRPPEFTGK